MAEVLRFRSARSPHRRELTDSDIVVVYRHGTGEFFAALAAASYPLSVARQFFTEKNLFSPIRAVSIPVIDKLDRFIRSKENAASREGILKVLDLQPDAYRTGVLKDFLETLRTHRLLLADSLVASLLIPEVTESLDVAGVLERAIEQEVRDDIVRKLLIFGLLEFFFEHPSDDWKLSQTSEMLRWRTLVLPPELEEITRKPLHHIGLQIAGTQKPRRAAAYSRRAFVTRVGFADHYVLKSEWIRYEAGEVAHIENVMAGEDKGRKHVRMDEKTVSTTVETDVHQFSEQDSQTTERFELNESASRDTDLSVHADGQINTSGQYGPTKVDTHIGGSLDYSQRDSQQRATTQARETVSRAITRVEQRVHNIRSTTSVSRVEETNTHDLKNATDTHVAGVYRWVDKIQRFQLFRYPNRMLMEFQVPEPAAWWRWLQAAGAMSGIKSVLPKPFTLDGNAESATNELLKFTDITKENYANIGARYAALGLEPPPSNVLVSETFTKDTENPRDAGKIKANDPVRYLALGNIKIPLGMVAKNAWWRPHTWYEEMLGGNVNHPSLALLIGNDSHDWSSAHLGGFGLRWNEASFGPIPLSDGQPTPRPAGMTKVEGISQAELKVALQTDNIRGYNISVTVECVPSEETMTKWQISTYEKLADAYYSLKRVHDEETNAARVRSGVVIEGDSPERNAEVVREQLKFNVLRLLFGDANRGSQVPFTWGDLIDRDSVTLGPVPLSAEANLRAPTIQFLEQAFEWDKLSYVLYPFFWATNWSEIADIKSPDPEFAKFLRSGSARVVLPARPGFESAVELFLDFGAIWSGGPAPTIGNPHYLSIADEIRTLHKAPDKAEPCDWWDERLPTTLVWLDGAQTLPEKPSTNIALGEKYQ